MRICMHTAARGIVDSFARRSRFASALSDVFSLSQTFRPGRYVYFYHELNGCMYISITNSMDHNGCMYISITNSMDHNGGMYISITNSMDHNGGMYISITNSMDHKTVTHLMGHIEILSSHQEMLYQMYLVSYKFFDQGDICICTSRTQYALGWV